MSHYIRYHDTPIAYTLAEDGVFNVGAGDQDIAMPDGEIDEDMHELHELAIPRPILRH